MRRVREDADVGRVDLTTLLLPALLPGVNSLLNLATKLLGHGTLDQLAVNAVVLRLVDLVCEVLVHLDRVADERRVDTLQWKGTGKQHNERSSEGSTQKEVGGRQTCSVVTARAFQLSVSARILSVRSADGHCQHLVSKDDQG